MPPLNVSTLCWKEYDDDDDGGGGSSDDDSISYIRHKTVPSTISAVTVSHSAEKDHSCTAKLYYFFYLDCLTSSSYI
jgi:hypothetical protein